VAFDYRIVALRERYEQVRLADKTEQWNQMRAHALKRRTTPGAKFVPPKPPEPPVPARPGVKSSGK